MIQKLENLKFRVLQNESDLMLGIINEQEYEQMLQSLEHELRALEENLYQFALENGVYCA